MPYKDKGKQREAVKRAVDKHRKGITSEGITGEGITRIEFIKQELKDEDLIKGIEAASLRFNDRDARYERAYRYLRWQNGEVIEPALPYALVYDRERLEKVTESLKEFKQDENVYYGCGRDSTPFDLIGEYLEVTK